MSSELTTIMNKWELVIKTDIYNNWFGLLLYTQAWSKNILNTSNYLKLGEKRNIINATPSSQERFALKNYTQNLSHSLTLSVDIKGTGNWGKDKW